MSYWFDPNLEADENDHSQLRAVAGPSKANLEGSQLVTGEHIVQIDIDIPHEYVKSSTPGHAHLRFPDLRLTTEQYDGLLLALFRADIIDEGNVKMFKKHGQTFLRLQPVKKKPERSCSCSRCCY